MPPNFLPEQSICPSTLKRKQIRSYRCEHSPMNEEQNECGQGITKQPTPSKKQL
jgi:hypothetical protein